MAQNRQPYPHARKKTNNRQSVSVRKGKRTDRPRGKGIEKIELVGTEKAGDRPAAA